MASSFARVCSTTDSVRGTLMHASSHATGLFEFRQRDLFVFSGFLYLLYWSDPRILFSRRPEGRKKGKKRRNGPKKKDLINKRNAGVSVWHLLQKLISNSRARHEITKGKKKSSRFNRTWELGWLDYDGAGLVNICDSACGVHFIACV
jgi:hypothetical protein